MIRRPPRSTLSSSSAASDVYKRQYQRRVHGTKQNYQNPPQHIMSESEFDYEEEAKDEVIESIKFYSSSHEKQQSKQLRKTFSADFSSLKNPQKQQYKQIDKLLKNSAYNYKKPQSLLKELKKNQQKSFIVFLINNNENIQLSVNHQCQMSSSIRDLISELVTDFNKQLDNCELINDYKLYQLFEATENGEKQPLSSLYEYTTKINEIESKFLLFEPRTNNFLFYQQVRQDSKIPLNLIQKFEQQQTSSTANSSQQSNRKQSLVDYYSSGMSSLLENYQERTKSNNIDDIEIKNVVNDNFKEFRSTKAQLIKPMKDQCTHEISSCNFFSIFKMFKTKKIKSK
eukprot:TRINITY_DN5906_c0_g1_i4.p1 TRINITY_DN5906_c0_g1~~TRINITY_DN5906_c0_g1_i4.p1  ORF type:complete len:342 (+),score=60.73 TRINITY_DN5906_c0_g1_i4:122-1147(+)